MTSYFELRRWLTVLAFALILAGGTRTAAAAEAKRSEDRQLPARQLAQLIVENPAGSIALQGEARQDLALAVQYRVWGRSAAAVSAIVADLRIEVHERDGRLRLRPVYGERLVDGPRPSFLAGAQLSVDLRLRLPAGLPVAASVTRDKLSVAGLNEDLVLAATSGEVEASQLGGSLEVGFTSGLLRASDIQGDVAVTATSGDLDLRRVGGSATLHSITGDMRVEDVSGDASVETTGGDLLLVDLRGRLEVISGNGEVAIRRPGGDLKVNCANGDLSVVDLGPTTKGGAPEVFLANSSGDIEVLLLPGVGFAVDAATDLGAMQLRLPLKVEDLTRRHVSGRLGDGAGRLRVVTATGDIRITLATDKTRTTP